MAPPEPPSPSLESLTTDVEQREGWGREWLRSLRSLLAWVLLALVLRWLVVEPRWIPSGSMLPTLQLQDRVLVEKLSQRLHHSPAPGTIVVFHPPAALQAAGYDPDAALIKRVVAVAGDTVQVSGGRLWRNGEKASHDWASEPMDYDFGPVTVPAAHLLVLGDNRNASLDSHLWGPLPEREVIGRAVWRYWPLQRFGPIRFSHPAPGLGAAEELR
ncbi:signal peptidase I [Cyanobium sp. FGCU-52]|nr:signal peptidase I [Cyanobium sp. FGCU52]